MELKTYTALCRGTLNPYITSRASLFLHQIHITTGITQKPGLTESQPAVLQMKIEHSSAQSSGTSHLSIKQPYWIVNKQALFIMIADSSQKNGWLVVFLSGFSATRSHLLFRIKVVFWWWLLFKSF